MDNLYEVVTRRYRNKSWSSYDQESYFVIAQDFNDASAKAIEHIAKLMAKETDDNENKRGVLTEDGSINWDHLNDLDKYTPEIKEIKYINNFIK